MDVLILTLISLFAAYGIFELTLRVAGYLDRVIAAYRATRPIDRDIDFTPRRPR